MFTSYLSILFEQVRGSGSNLYTIFESQNIGGHKWDLNNVKFLFDIAHRGLPVSRLSSSDSSAS